MTVSFFQRFSLAVLLLIFAALSNPAQQSDPSFGSNGLVVRDLLGITATSKDTAVKAFYLPDGKILVVAHQRTTSFKSPPRNFSYLFRYLNNGTRDVPFGASVNNFVATDAAMQPDGKIVVAGYTFQNEPMEQGQDWKIIRFNSDASPDTTFGTGGTVIRGFGANLDFATNVELQADGKIVVSGYSTQGFGGGVTVVARFNADGSIDAPFGPYGEGFFDLYDNTYLSKELIILPDGKFLLAGDSASPFFLLAPSDIFLARFNSNGAVDPSFGSGGYLTLDYNVQDIFYDVELQPDGKILVALDSVFPAPGANYHVERQGVLARFSASGVKDASFGASGDVFINRSPPLLANQAGSPPSGYESARSIVVRGNGNIVISGVSVQIVVSDTLRRHVFSVLEYSGSGQLIGKNFSRRTRSNQIVSFQGQTPKIKGSFEQPDGKIVMYGSSIDAESSNTDDIILARYLSASAVNNANLFFDYEFNGDDELAVYRPNNSGLGTWFFMNRFNQLFERQYGAAGDVPVPGDYDGDGVQDLAVFRPATGEWISRKIYLDNCAPMDCVETVQFGAAGDIPAPGDFDGDGKFDRAVFRPGEGNWYILFSTGGYTGLHFGQNGDKPVTGDFDGDGKSDVAVIRRQNGQMFWYILQSSDNQFIGIQFGITEDKTVAADYDNDGKTEIAVWRPSNGTWYRLANYTDFSFLQFGANGDIPEPIDFDGDRKIDWAIFRPSVPVHYILRTTDGIFISRTLGAATDTPVASAYVR
jgi:uncharacterized delta-60 repeat protein